MLLLSIDSYGQDFLSAYKKYRPDNLGKIENSQTRKKLQRYVNSQIIELDTIFQSYRSTKDFDCNTADTLFLIYESPAESPFANDITIWSGKDTISYRQVFQQDKPGKIKRAIIYQPFSPRQDKSERPDVVTKRDLVISLVASRNYQTLNHLGNNHTISDGSFISIYVVYKNGGQYKFESCFPPQFSILDLNAISNYQETFLLTDLSTDND